MDNNREKKHNKNNSESKSVIQEGFISSNKPHYEYKYSKKEKDKLKEDGLLIVEHGAETKLENRTHFQFVRTYGNIHFSFFEKR